MAWLVLALLVIGFGAAALGRKFRLYSIATLAVFVVFGTLTGLDGPPDRGGPAHVVDRGAGALTLLRRMGPTTRTLEVSP